MHRGYIKLWRKITESSFYQNSYCVHLALHLVITANHKETKFLFNKQEMELQRGQRVCGRHKLSLETGISQRSIRTSLEILSNIGFLTIKSTNRFSVITILKYEDYQSQEEIYCQPNDQQVTNKRPTSDQQMTTSKELRRMKKNEEEEQTVPAEPKEKHLSCVYLTKEEHEKLLIKFGQEETDKWIYELNNGIMSKGYKYKSHYHTILKWKSRDEKRA